MSFRGAPLPTQGGNLLQPDYTFLGRQWSSAGVMRGVGGGLEVSAAEVGMGVEIATGRAYCRGVTAPNDVIDTLEANIGHASLERVDRVVVRFTFSDRQSSVQSAIHAGTPGQGAPALLQTEDVYELLLADLTIPATTTTLTAGMVSDRRSFASGLLEALEHSVATAEARTNPVFGGLATPQTIDNNLYAGPNGRMFVTCSAYMTGADCLMDFALTGASTRAASDATALRGNGISASRTTLVEGLVPGGRYILTAQFRVPVGTGTFADRQIIAVPVA